MAVNSSVCLWLYVRMYVFLCICMYVYHHFFFLRRCTFKKMSGLCMYVCLYLCTIYDYMLKTFSLCMYMYICMYVCIYDVQTNFLDLFSILNVFVYVCMCVYVADFVFRCCSAQDGSVVCPYCVPECIKNVVDMRDFGSTLLQLRETGMHSSIMYVYMHIMHVCIL